MTRAAARRVWGLMYRHLALYRRSWPRLLELAYWPVLQMCIWGFTASFLASRIGSSAVLTGATLLFGLQLWQEPLRGQKGVTVNFVGRLMIKNIGHVFVSPMRPWELVARIHSTRGDHTAAERARRDLARVRSAMGID